MAGRKTKKKKEQEELLADDAFLQKGTEGAGWFEKNFKLVLAGIAVVLVGVLVAQMMSAQTARANAEVTSKLNEAVDAYREATGLQKVLTSTAPESLKKEWQKVHDQLSELRAANQSHGAAKMAALYQADLARRLEKFDAAVGLYDEYLSTAKKDDSLRFFALEGAGYALEGAGKDDEAIARFDELAKTQAFYKDYALKHKARVLEKKGDDAAAIAAYEAIVEMDPASPLKSFAENRLKALK